MAKIIGVEVKAETVTGERAELAMFGCQVPLPVGVEVYFEVTLHTTEGDVTLRQRMQSDHSRRFIYDDGNSTGSPLQRAANVLHP